MPYYSWRDNKTGYVVHVLRSFSRYEEPPKDEELPEEEQGKPRDWERIITKGPVIANPNKGNW